MSCASAGGSPTSSPQAPAPPSQTGAGPEPETAPLTPELAAGARVRDIRVTQDPLTLVVGDTITLGDLRPVPVDEDGNPVRGAPLMYAPLSEPEASMTPDERIIALQEGETDLLLAVMAPGPGNAPEPQMFPVHIIVRGAPVASLTVLPPEQSVYTETVVPFGVEARTATGDLRTRVDITWASRNPEIASVNPAGFVRGNRPGRATLTVSAEGVETEHVVEVRENPVRRIELSPDDASVRTGDVVHFAARPLDGSGREVRDVAVTYAVAGEGMRAELGASAYEDGAFVADRPGDYRIVASAGNVSANAVVEARARDVAQTPVRVGVGLVSHAPTSDLWVFRGVDGRDYAYTGTHEGGQKMYAWDVTDPSAPALTDSVVVDARVVNDVKVNADATLAVITREGASNRRNGIVLLDLAVPAHPTVIAEYTENLTGGVHNTFISGDLVYAIDDGTLDVHIIDISDPTKPFEAGRWGIDKAGKYLHDIWIVDGIAYVSYWGDGVWILDVGDGRWGGTPTKPAVISSYAYPEGHTHVAFPYRNSDGHAYLFLGDEIFDCDDCTPRDTMGERVSRGFVHILDVDDIEHPVEVGRYEVPEAGAHNIWAEDDRLYVAYYQGGLRVVDVSGELRGDLYEQGREIAWFPTGYARRTPGERPHGLGAATLQRKHLRVGHELGSLGDPPRATVDRPPFPVKLGRLALLGLAFAASGCASAGAPAAGTSASGGSRAAPAPPATEYRVYVANESSDVVSRVVFDPASGARVEREIPVGVMPADLDGPHGLTVSPDGEFWYLSLAHGTPDGALWKFRAGADSLVGRTTLGRFPATIAVSPNGQMILVANFNLHGDPVPSSLSVVYAPDMRELKKITTCVTPHGSRTNASGTSHYSACVRSDQIVEVSLVTLEVAARFSVRPGAEGPLELDDLGVPGPPDPTRSTCSPTWVTPGIGPRADRFVYVACSAANQVLEIDVPDWTVTRRFDTGAGPYNMAVTTDGRRLVVTLKGDQGVAVLDLDTGAELAEMDASEPITHGVVISPDDRYAFVTNEAVGSTPGTLDVFDLAGFERVASVDLRFQPGGIGFWRADPAGRGPTVARSR